MTLRGLIILSVHVSRGLDDGYFIAALYTALGLNRVRVQVHLKFMFLLGMIVSLASLRSRGAFMQLQLGVLTVCLVQLALILPLLLYSFVSTAVKKDFQPEATSR